MQVPSTFLDSRSPTFTWFRARVGATKSWQRFYEKTREFPRGLSTEDEQHFWTGLTQIVFVKYVNSFLSPLMKVFNTTMNFIWSKYSLLKRLQKRIDKTHRVEIFFTGVFGRYITDSSSKETIMEAERAVVAFKVLQRKLVWLKC